MLFVWQILLGFYKEFLYNCFWFHMNRKAMECYTLSKAHQANRALNDHEPQNYVSINKKGEERNNIPGQNGLHMLTL
jgi:hypothetical protein